MAIEGRDLAFYSVPLAIACVAGYFAFRYFTAGPPEPSNEPDAIKILDPCFPGRFRCHDGAIETTSGDRTDAGTCVWKSVDRCLRACVAADTVTLLGPPQDVARTQLCDPPADPGALAQTVPVSEGTSCLGDGYAPSEGGIVECVLRSGKDPNALGVVIQAFACRAGGIETDDRDPRLVTREQAIAIWCKRPREATAVLTADAGVGADAGTMDAGDAGPFDAAVTFDVGTADAPRDTLAK